LPHAKQGDESAAGKFTGWMLLNYGKPVEASSAASGHPVNHAVDEDIKTYWSAASGDSGEWFQSDLGATSTVRAIQINYADEGASLMGKQLGLSHRYLLQSSVNGIDWTPLVDKSEATADAPHDYIELEEPVQARFIRLENRGVPSGKFALSGLRVFGHGGGGPPAPVEGLEVLRGDSERRNAWVRWRTIPEATGCVIYCGRTPQKLYTSVMVYGAAEYYFRALDAEGGYFFQIEAFNENGVSRRSPVVEVR
jgi:hypothetical protein